MSPRAIFNLFVAALTAAIIGFPVGLILAFATGYWQWLTLTVASYLYLFYLFHRDRSAP